MIYPCHVTNEIVSRISFQSLVSSGFCSLGTIAQYEPFSQQINANLTFIDVHLKTKLGKESLLKVEQSNSRTAAAVFLQHRDVHRPLEFLSSASHPWLKSDEGLIAFVICLSWRLCGLSLHRQGQPVCLISESMVTSRWMDLMVVTSA
jgi:hypothetical protein